MGLFLGAIELVIGLILKQEIKRGIKKKQLIPKLVVKQGNGRHYLLRD